MLLVIDIGNTNIVLGVFRGEELAFSFRLKSDTGRTRDEYSALLVTLLKEKLGDNLSFASCIISSVVPPITPIIASLVKRQFGTEPVLVGPGVKTGLSIKITEPATVGADRVVNAVAARQIYGYPSIIVDFGTATSFDYVGNSGDYEGGIIAPGLRVSLESLVRNTAKLPHIELAWPKSIIGKSTVGAMQAGTVVGYLCMVDGLLDEMLKETGPVKKIIATGGLGDLMTKHSKRIEVYEKDLTLQGLRFIAALNR